MSLGLLGTHSPSSGVLNISDVKYKPRGILENQYVAKNKIQQDFVLLILQSCRVIQVKVSSERFIID